MYLTEHFNSEEFNCQCGCGTGHIAQNLVLILEKVRVAIDRPMRINSGIRCLEYNRSIKSSDTSSHIKGIAVDVGCTQMSDRYLLMNEFVKHFKRIGIHKEFIHVDIDTEKRNGIFVY
jgi:uncharacterized protein YcbK (DUF882 family)